MRELMKNKRFTIIGICVFVIMIITIIILQMQNRKLGMVNDEIESSYEEVNKRYDELFTQNKELLRQAMKNEVIIKELQIENKSLKENTGETDLGIDQSNDNNDAIEKKNEVSNVVDENSNLNDKADMLNKARKFFGDRGIKISSNGYSEMVGTNLNSGISELEGHRVFAFTIENYDIKDNNVWFYYSPETNAGYRYENETWMKL